jgi:hypothetical protein
MARDSLPNDEDDPVQTDSTEMMINDLYSDSLRLSSIANRKASVFKGLYITCVFVIIVAGAATGILSINNDEYIVSAIGFVTTAIQALATTFSFERRGVLLKDVSNKLRKVSRQIRSLQNTDIKQKDKMRKLEEYYDEVNELDLNMFDNAITTSTMAKATNVLPVTSVRRTDSDSNAFDDNSSPSRLPPNGISISPLKTPAKNISDDDRSKTSPPISSRKKDAKLKQKSGNKRFYAK